MMLSRLSLPRKLLRPWHTALVWGVHVTSCVSVAASTVPAAVSSVEEVVVTVDVTGKVPSPLEMVTWVEGPPDGTSGVRLRKNMKGGSAARGTA